MPTARIFWISVEFKFYNWFCIGYHELFYTPLILDYIDEKYDHYLFAFSLFICASVTLIELKHKKKCSKVMHLISVVKK